MEMESADEGSVEVDSADEEGVEMQVETQETAYFSAEEAHSDHFHTPNDAAPNEHGYDSPREEPQPQQKVTKVARPKKPPRLSRHGLPVPGVPRAYLKQLSSKFLNGRVGKPVLDAIEDATFSFLEQMSGDMAAYALHAKRKTIDMEDGILLMKRQRLITDEHSLALLARDMLPRELSDELVPMARPGNDVSGYWAD
jgi:histone H3/H4